MQPFPGELPLTRVIGQVFTLLLQRHLPGVHDDGQVASLDVCMGWLGDGYGDSSLTWPYHPGFSKIVPRTDGLSLGTPDIGGDRWTTSCPLTVQPGGVWGASQDTRLPGEPG